MGRHHSLETRKKMSEAHKGKKHPFYGKHHSVETRRKQSEAQKGEKNPQWNPSISEERRRVERGHWKARKMYHPPKGKEIHHIDDDPLNNDPKNIGFVTRREHMIEDGRLFRRNKQGRFTSK